MCYFEDLPLNCDKVVVAVSGGIDSLSLVILANKYLKNVKIIGVTVDHKLRPSSTDEANYVNKLLTSFGIEHHILTWNRLDGENVNEDKAREARYSLIENFCKENGVNTVFVGHHAQDQAENFLIRLFRGSGILGLSSIKSISKRGCITVMRPLLNEKKENLKLFLEQNNIKWVEDESNTDEKYLRNKIRNFLNSFEEKDLIIGRINSAVDVFNSANSIIEDNIEDLKNFGVFSENTINYDEFLKLDKEIQRRIVGRLLKFNGDKKDEIRGEKLDRLIDLIKSGKIKNYEINGCRINKKNNLIKIEVK